MTSTRLFCLAMMIALPGLILAADANGPVQTATICPQCQCQEQIVYKDCITYRCKLVPDKKPIKKTVYEVKEVPFCLQKLPPFCSLFGHHHCCDDCCKECECPRYKRVLIKKEITCGEICTTKCEIEEVVTRVPCRVCSAGCPNCTQPAASAPPLSNAPPGLPPEAQQPVPPTVPAP